MLHKENILPIFEYLTSAKGTRDPHYANSALRSLSEPLPEYYIIIRDNSCAPLYVLFGEIGCNVEKLYVSARTNCAERCCRVRNYVGMFFFSRKILDKF